jgi:hypothetical protein
MDKKNNHHNFEKSCSIKNKKYMFSINSMPHGTKTGMMAIKFRIPSYQRKVEEELKLFIYSILTPQRALTHYFPP